MKFGPTGNTMSQYLGSLAKKILKKAKNNQGEIK